MKSILRIIRTTLVGGILFLVPLAIFFILLEKAYHIVQKITLPLSSHLPKVKILGLALQEIIGLVIIIVICFLAGIVAKTKTAKNLVTKLEDKILSLIPGYSFMKGINENIFGTNDEENLKVILARVDDGWQFAFLIEQINEDHFTVFIPDAPNPMGGGVYFMEKERIKEVPVSQREALQCIRKLGFGSAALLKDVL
ncbi:DUF502 domain-containing protein [Flavobacterium sp. FlaQc-52]|jgi:uncharacterized membrane protein|uniref:DUF502 domain-containing protein n=1 Tax=Flavobacterium cupriresistens TaxID=2893885 RepID=A0ABU4RGT3_9FLAO|nr:MULTISPECIES: DUF502 domain-containing protein [unclassified Flavobacterium]MDX6190914.1 DUF502 domain-containing protein [Flavobacterium sp. Fl-318]UFH43914.1 DUF502 domain-containing protein [Flavobacterium sp. F-323]